MPFRTFVAEESQQGRDLSVDHLILLRYLLRHPEVDATTAAHLCQRPEPQARELLSEMELRFGYLERGGGGKGTYWTLQLELHRRLAAPGDPERDRRMDWEAAKTRVLSVLMQRAKRGEPGLTNTEIRAMTRLNRKQVTRLLTELRAESQVRAEGERRWARWTYSTVE